MQAVLLLATFTEQHQDIPGSIWAAPRSLRFPPAQVGLHGLTSTVFVVRPVRNVARANLQQLTWCGMQQRVMCKAKRGPALLTRPFSRNVSSCCRLLVNLSLMSSGGHCGKTSWRSNRRCSPRMAPGSRSTRNGIAPP